MNIESIRDNIKQMNEISRELYVFLSQIEVIRQLEIKNKAPINSEEKKLLSEAVVSLTNQLRILNNSIPQLVEGIGFFKKLKPEEKNLLNNQKEKLVQIEYKADEVKDKISLTISDKEKKEFLENLSKSNLTIFKLKKKYATEKPQLEFTKPSLYAKISNHFFRETSNNLVAKKYFDTLNVDLRKMNSQFVVSTYVSMMLFTVLMSFLFSILVYITLLMFEPTLDFPFLKELPVGDTVLGRLFKFFWVMIIIPILTGGFMYLYPGSEAKNLGKKIDQELPFVAIHMSAIATSGIEPMSIFKIILRSDEYKYTNIEFRKLINLINFHGKDFVGALRETARTCPSEKLKHLLDGLATSITSGGNLHEYLDKHSETLLFDYKLEREKYTKTSETFMDIYISVVIAAPMIFLMLFVIMASTGATVGGLSIDLLSMLIILGIVFINILFLFFLKVKQPVN